MESYHKWDARNAVAGAKLERWSDQGAAEAVSRMMVYLGGEDRLRRRNVLRESGRQISKVAVLLGVMLTGKMMEGEPLTP